MSDSTNEQATDDYLANVQAREDAPDVDPDEEGEDIEAFLADLEDSAQEPASAPSAAEPDPFADAFASLSDDGPSLDDDAVAAKLAALTPAAPPKKKKKAPPKVEVAPEPAPEPEPEVAPPPKEVAKEAAPPKEVAPPEEPAKEESKKDKKDKKDKKAADPKPGVESQRAPGFVLFVFFTKWSFFLLPAFVLWWVGGSILAGWVATGWIVALVATLVAFIVPAVLRLISARGKYGWWVFGVGLVLSASLIAPMPGFVAKRLGNYGHWPMTTVGQLASWKADNPGVRLNSKLAGFLGEKLGNAVGQTEALAPLDLGAQSPLGQASGTTPNVTKTDTPKTDTPKTDTPKADAPKVDPGKADPTKADPTKATPPSTP